MKHAVLIGIVVLAWCGFCIAQGVKLPAPATAAKGPEIKTVVGKVASVTVADPAKATKSEIVVTEENGKTITFLVKTTTTIYDTDLKAIVLDKITKDQKVRVKYMISKEGVGEATAIYVMK
jgi:hypothetical protein